MPCEVSIVVDSDVMQSAGESGSVRAVECRQLLLTLLNNARFCVCVSPDVRSEWTQHWSGFARTWFAGMTARRRVLTVRPRDRVLRTRLEIAARSEKERLAMLKDAHLLEAALLCSHRIASLDEVARNSFANASAECSEIADVVWVNPTNSSEGVCDWLDEGGMLEPTRTLGRREAVATLRKDSGLRKSGKDLSK